jgi:hypothetical protein
MPMEGVEEEEEIGDVFIALPSNNPAPDLMLSHDHRRGHEYEHARFRSFHAACSTSDVVSPLAPNALTALPFSSASRSRIIVSVSPLSSDQANSVSNKALNGAICKIVDTNWHHSTLALRGGSAFS